MNYHKEVQLIGNRTLIIKYKPMIQKYDRNKYPDQFDNIVISEWYIVNNADYLRYLESKVRNKILNSPNVFSASAISI